MRSSTLDEFFRNRNPLTHQMIVCIQYIVIRSVLPDNAVRIPLPHIQWSLDLLFPVRLCKDECQSIEETILMDRQLLVETDAVIDQPFPSDDLAMNKHDIIIMVYQMDASFAVHRFLNERCSEQIVLVFCHSAEDCVQCEYCCKAVIEVAEHHIVRIRQIQPGIPCL